MYTNTDYCYLQWIKETLLSLMRQPKHQKPFKTFQSFFLQVLTMQNTQDYQYISTKTWATYVAAARLKSLHI